MNEARSPPHSDSLKEDEISVSLTPPLSPSEQEEEEQARKQAEISALIFSENGDRPDATYTEIMCAYCDYWCNLRGPIEF